MNIIKKSTITAVMAVSFFTLLMSATVNAESNPFESQHISTIVTDNDGTKCGEGKCGEGKMTSTTGSDSKCGEGKCGEGKMKAAPSTKCGEGKCGEGKMKAASSTKCGEGKCGESKSKSKKCGE
ncbi:hypothetical protein [Colwellia echini]|uniref:Low-complexity protein n=1 Tax=Colwellia echini TaxID=1982103 RepID=A0ABY3MYY0_9GAMM|nr:hypothetical protein [Colwellia echini]TYK66415.1 hypothetical protein CWS31_005540 [Colwellia echini]